MLENPMPTLQPIGEQITKDGRIKNSGIKNAQDIFEMYLKKDDRMGLDEFSDVYAPEEIKKDQERVEFVKNTRGFEKPTENGIVLEKMFCDLAEKYEWFGEGSKLVHLSEFDDVTVNGAHCDAILEIPVGDDGFVVRVGIDLTSAVNYDALNKKRTKCLEGIQSGKLFSVKYFKSKIDDTKGRISDVPVFFAGINRETIKSLCETIAKQENTGNDFLKKHEAQFMFIDEIVSQTNRYVAMAMTKHGQEANITKWMEYYKQLFEWILDNKKAFRPNGYVQKAGQDDVYRYITKFV